MARHAEHQALALPIRPPHVPIHRWLHVEIRAAILNGRLSRGQRLPPTRDLGHQFRIPRGTVVAVFEQLAAEGYVTAAVGRGTHVASSLPDNLFTAVTPQAQTCQGVRPCDQTIQPGSAASSLTISTDCPDYPWLRFPCRPTGSCGFPPRTLVPDWKPTSGDAASACFSREETSRATGHCERPSPLISGHHARSGAQQSKLYCSRAFNRGSISVPVCWSIPMSVSGWKILAIRQLALS